MFSSDAEVDYAHTIITRTFSAGTTTPLDRCRWQLKQPWWMLTDYEPRILATLPVDLPIGPHIADIFALIQDILISLSHPRAWTKETKPGGNMINPLGRTTVRTEALGAALIIGT